MERTYIKELNDLVGSEVSVSGSVSVRRDHGKLIFFDLRDRTGFVQAVVTPKVSAHTTASMMRPEWVVEVVGTVNARPENMINKEQPQGSVELKVESIKVLNKAQELPFEIDTELNLDTYLDYMPLSLRSKEAQRVFKTQAKITKAYREILNEKGFTEFQTPKLVGGDAEGGANVFKVEYFHDHNAYLATSPQLYKQIMVGALERVFSVGTVFRAEKHSTTRHTNEYTSLDAEFGFIEDHKDVMNVLSDVMRHIAIAVEDVSELKIPKEIPTIKLREALKLISKETGEDCVDEPDLEPAHERWLSEYALSKFDSDFIFITHYPVSKRPFYTYEDENDEGFTKSFDLLFRGVEITTGGQRVHEYDTLVRKLKEKGLKEEDFSFYLQTFKYGIAPHGGWGMGLERLTQKVLNLDNIKEATLFPREINRIDTLLSE